MVEGRRQRPFLVGPKVEVSIFTLYTPVEARFLLTSATTTRWHGQEMPALGNDPATITRGWLLKVETKSKF